jgi:hypothetical protein
MAAGQTSEAPQSYLQMKERQAMPYAAAGDDCWAVSVTPLFALPSLAA